MYEFVFVKIQFKIQKYLSMHQMQFIPFQNPFTYRDGRDLEF